MHDVCFVMLWFSASFPFHFTLLYTALKMCEMLLSKSASYRNNVSVTRNDLNTKEMILLTILTIQGVYGLAVALEATDSFKLRSLKDTLSWT